MRKVETTVGPPASSSSNNFFFLNTKKRDKINGLPAYCWAYMGCCCCWLWDANNNISRLHDGWTRKVAAKYISLKQHNTGRKQQQLVDWHLLRHPSPAVMMMIKKREIHPASVVLLRCSQHSKHTAKNVYSTLYNIPYKGAVAFLHTSKQHVCVVEGSFVIITCVSQQLSICRQSFKRNRRGGCCSCYVHATQENK